MILDCAASLSNELKEWIIGYQDRQACDNEWISAQFILFLENQLKVHSLLIMTVSHIRKKSKTPESNRRVKIHLHHLLVELVLIKLFNLLSLAFLIYKIEMKLPIL